MRLRIARVCLAAVGMLTMVRPSLAAQETAVPIEVHVPLLVKILNFDRNLPMKVQEQVRVGVVYQNRYRTSATVADGVRGALAALPEDILGGPSIRVVPIDLDNTEDLGAALRQQKLHALYVAPIRAVDLDVVTRATRTAQILTLTGVPRYVETGLAVGIDRRGERPQIVINLQASRAEGADFTAQLLKLARIVKP